MKWICSQIGAREHYAVPRVLHRAGKLEHLYTDLWAGTMWRAIGSLTRRPLLGSRHHPELADARVTSFDMTTIMDSILGGDLKRNPYDWFLYVGKDFGRSVVESLIRQKTTDWRQVVFFAYDTGFLEPAQWIKSKGGKAIVCQMDPSRFEVELVMEEGRHWPDLAKRVADVPEAYFLRREAEWAVADLVMVNSEWTRKALIKQGVNDEKLVVVPLSYEVGKQGQNLKPETRNLNGKNLALDISCLDSGVNSGLKSQVSSFSQKQPLRVLFLGQVILRKGIQYLIEAARMLGNEPVHFDVVGSIGISEAGVKSAPSNMTFHGPVNRLETDSFYRAADLFVLPTLSDGFALTQLEAMAYGLPVITTPNCGEVVTHDVDGLIIAPKDARALAEAIRTLTHDTRKMKSMGLAARAKAAQFSLDRLGNNLTSLENRISANESHSSESQ